MGMLETSLREDTCAQIFQKRLLFVKHPAPVEFRISSNSLMGTLFLTKNQYFFLGCRQYGVSLTFKKWGKKTSRNGSFFFQTSLLVWFISLLQVPYSVCFCHFCWSLRDRKQQIRHDTGQFQVVVDFQVSEHQRCRGKQQVFTNRLSRLP